MTMTNFEDRLISELIEEHGAALATVERPAGRRGNGRPLWIGGGAVAVAAAIAIGITLVGGGSAPAYAVTQNPDGTVTLTLNELSGIDGANQRLHQLGLPVVVVPATADCAAPSARPLDLDQSNPYMMQHVLPNMPFHSNGVTFDVRDIPAGATLMVSGGSQAVSPPGNGTGIWMTEGLIQGSAPSCVKSPGPITVAPAGPSAGGMSGAPVTP